jgi:hypothetical protein
MSGKLVRPATHRTTDDGAPGSTEDADRLGFEAFIVYVPPLLMEPTIRVCAFEPILRWGSSREI